LVREFVKGLFDEFGARQSMMDPHALATPFGDGSNAGVRLQLGGGVPARPVGSERGGAARRTDIPGTGEAGEDFVIAMRRAAGRKVAGRSGSKPRLWVAVPSRSCSPDRGAHRGARPTRPATRLCIGCCSLHWPW